MATRSLRVGEPSGSSSERDELGEPRTMLRPEGLTWTEVHPGGEGMGSQPARSTRPDAEPTINEAGQQGFAIDGTDSFSVPGPADGLPPDPGDEDAMARIAAMRRLLVTLGAAVAVLLVVIIVGRTGGSGPSDRLAGAAEGPDVHPAVTVR